MLYHCALLTYRTFLRHKSTFVINLVGLSTGLAFGLLIYLWVSDERSMDKFHHQDAQLYQVRYNAVNEDKITTMNDTPGPLGPALAETFPEVISAVTVAPPHGVYSGIVTRGEKNLKAKPYYVSGDFFKVFSFPLLQGDKNKVLGQRHWVLLSEELALKLFGTTRNVIGKTIEWKHATYGGPFTVSGVFARLPQNSSLQFDLLFHYEVFLDKRPDLKGWNSAQPRVYLVLREGADVGQFNAKINQFHHSKLQNPRGSTLFVQRFSEKYLHGLYQDGRPAGGRITYVQLFSLLAGFILLIASINFVNLTTAKAATRLKEVGVKKAIGASRRQLVLHYLGESLVMTLFSLLVALLLARQLLPQFNRLSGKQVSLHLDFSLAVALLTIALLVSLAAGIYPALFLSSFKPSTVLKGN